MTCVKGPKKHPSVLKSDASIDPQVRSLKPSATLAVNEKSGRLIGEGRKVYRLGFGQSPFPVPPGVVKALQDNAFQKDYLPVRGLFELRKAVAGFHQRRHGLPATAVDVFIGPGSKELMFILQMIWRGKVLVPSPAWVSHAPQAHLLGRRIVRLPTRFEDGWRLMPETLERFCRKNPDEDLLLILNYPNNPTGATLSAEHLEKLAEVAGKYKILVLSDEIYGELDHRAGHVSLAVYYPAGTIVSNGLSKWCGAGGWRLGTFCFPENLRWMTDLFAKIAGETFSAVSAPIQYAALAAFTENVEIEQYLTRTRRILGALGQDVARRLQKSDVKILLPEGGFYLFPDFSNHAEKLRERGVANSPQFCQKLLEETGVALLPGADFGRPADELTCRLAYVDFDGARCLENYRDEIDKDYLRENCGRVLEAIDLIGGWLEE